MEKTDTIILSPERIGRLYSGVNNKRNEYIRTLPGGSDGGRYCYRNIGKLQCFHRESQKQENFQRFSHCRIGIEWQHRASLSVDISRKQAEDSIHRHRARAVSLPVGIEAHLTFGRLAGIQESG